MQCNETVKTQIRGTSRKEESIHGEKRRIRGVGGGRLKRIRMCKLENKQKKRPDKRDNTGLYKEKKTEKKNEENRRTRAGRWKGDNIKGYR